MKLISLSEMIRRFTFFTMIFVIICFAWVHCSDWFTALLLTAYSTLYICIYISLNILCCRRFWAKFLRIVSRGGALRAPIWSCYVIRHQAVCFSSNSLFNNGIKVLIKYSRISQQVDDTLLIIEVLIAAQIITVSKSSRLERWWCWEATEADNWVASRDESVQRGLSLVPRKTWLSLRGESPTCTVAHSSAVDEQH